MIAQRTGRLIAAVAAPLFLLHAQPGHCRPAADAPAAGATLPHVSITSMGRGSPVILIPGLSSPRATWDGIAPHLAASHRVILVQVNGFGGDDPGANLKPGVLDGVVADLHFYIVANRLGSPAVIGHSMGGLIGLMLAKAHPADVGRLMVVDSLPWFGMVFGPEATMAAAEPQAAAMRDRAAASYGQPANPAADQAMAARMAVLPESQAKVAGWMAKADARVTGEAMYEDVTTDLRPAMAGIATPITLVYPWSAVMPRERADPFYKAAYRDAPHVSFVPVADSGHFVMLDQPAAFAAAVDGFLQ